MTTIQHPTLGTLTEEEFRYMRQVPIGHDKAEWTPEQLANIRRRLAHGPGNPTFCSEEDHPAFEIHCELENSEDKPIPRPTG